MKIVSILLVVLFCFPSVSCKNRFNAENSKLNLLLKEYNLDIEKYKVICITPADGCASCIMPVIEYFKEKKKDYLLVISSHFKKSLRDFIVKMDIDTNKILIDKNNLAGIMWLMRPTAPTVYLIDNKRIKEKIDFAGISDRKQAFNEIEKFFSGKD